MLDVGLEEGFGGRVVKRFDVGVDVAADALEGVDEAIEGKTSVSRSLYYLDGSRRKTVVVV